ncbi:hypothetical protein EST38_g3484 [Candolleomyces aberdarensis]|uniref:Homeobox domain-containing protein n=1 Tax=Candolleomyces aberdarensis TaxID=2316362 RepID=A0A4Q2DPT8_9AGAR|nr:hypothetical protein EST38_g3484 [Candolleomyces aberdarensis]
MSTWTTKLEEDHSHHHALAATSAVSPADAALSAANAAQRKGTKKLNKEGTAIILDFVNRNNGGELRITKAQAQEVAAEIRSKTGYEEMTFAKVQDWVKRRRVAVAKSKAQAAASPVTPYPSASSSSSAPTATPSSIQTSALTSPQIQMLESLISQFPDGVDDVQISTWATGFNVNRDLVKNLVGSRQKNRTPSLPPTPVSPSAIPHRHSWLQPDTRSFADRIAQTNANARQRLPTPADTVSSAGSPVVSHATVPKRPSSPAASPRSPRSPTPPPPPPTTSASTSSDAMEVDSSPLIQTPLTTVHPETRFIDPIVKGILEGVKGAARASPSAPAVLPRTAAELNALWAPFETKLNQLTESLAL